MNRLGAVLIVLCASGCLGGAPDDGEPSSQEASLARTQQVGAYSPSTDRAPRTFGVQVIRTFVTDKRPHPEPWQGDTPRAPAPSPSPQPGCTDSNDSAAAVTSK